MRFNRVFRAVCAGVTVCLLLSLCGFTEQCEGVSDRVLRLHVVAASDSEADQALKLKVRDAILAETGGVLDGIYNTQLAEETLASMMPKIESTVLQVLSENGVEDSVRVELCDMYFETRTYETVTLPAGEYRALRVTIGEGKGRNWWCVVFPPMCLSSACEQDVADVLTEEQTAIVTNASRYEVRLKILEWYYELRNRFQ